MNGIYRFKDLQKLIPNISQKVLTSQLKELGKSKLITRKAYHEIPPKVESSVTEYSKISNISGRNNVILERLIEKQ